MPALDHYERDVLDDEDYSDISQGDRTAAEQAMLRRDREEGARRGDADLLYGNYDISYVVVKILSLLARLKYFVVNQFNIIFFLVKLMIFVIKL